MFLTFWLWLGKLGLRVIRLGPKRESGESAREHEQRSRQWLNARTAAANAAAKARIADRDGGDLVGRLRQLKALRDDGLIDEAAYTVKRDEILDEL